MSRLDFAETTTPGVFYHGSRNLRVGEFRAQHKDGAKQTPAVWFTEIPNVAVDIGISRWGEGGRLYRCQLITKNPWFWPSEEWETRYEGRKSMEELDALNTKVCNQIRAEGYDSIVYHHDGTIIEIAVLKDGVVRRLDDDRLIRPKLVDAKFPLYCERSVWPLLDKSALREAGLDKTRFDYLVDPRDGSSLGLQPDLVRGPASLLSWNTGNTGWNTGTPRENGGNPSWNTRNTGNTRKR